MIILNPKVRVVQNAKASTAKPSLMLNPMPDDLNGKTIGFLDNGKKNFDAYLDRTEELLRKSYNFTPFRRRKGVPIKGITPEMFEEVAQQCDILITGAGD